MWWTRVGIQILMLLFAALPIVAQEESPQRPPNVDSLKALVNALQDSVVAKGNQLTAMNRVLQDSVQELQSARAKGESQERVLQSRRDSIAQLVEAYATQQRIVRDLETDRDTIIARREFLTRALASLNADFAQTKLAYTELQIREGGVTDDLQKERTKWKRQVEITRKQEVEIQQKDSITAILRQESDRKDREIAVQRDSNSLKDRTIIAVKEQAGADRQRYEDQLTFLRNGLRWAVLAATSITLLLFAFAAAAALRDYRSDVTSSSLHKFGLSATESLIVLESVRQWVWYRTVSTGLQYFLVLGVVVVCGLIALLLVFLLQTGATGIDLLSKKEFWQAVGAIGVPLVFLVTAHNAIETRRLELARLLCEVGKNPSVPQQEKPSQFQDPSGTSALDPVEKQRVEFTG